MKKNVILGFFGLALACGVAYNMQARPFAANPWVRVRYQDNTTACIQSDKLCDDAGDVNCSLTVHIQSGNVPATGKQSGCATIMKTTTLPSGVFSPSPVPVAIIP